MNSFLTKYQLNRITKIVQQLSQHNIAYISSYSYINEINKEYFISPTPLTIQHKLLKRGLVGIPEWSIKRYYNTDQNAKKNQKDSQEEEEIENFPQQLLKRLLLQKQDDNLIQLLNESSDFNTLLESVTCHVHEFEQQHFVQCVLLLWIFHNSAAQTNNSSKIELPIIDERLYLICNGLEKCILTMNADELAACYLYLGKIGIDANQASMEALLMQALQLIKNSPVNDDDNIIPLTALSHLSLAINTNSSLYVPIVCAHFMPHIAYKIILCKNAEEARLLAICLRNLQPLVDDELLSAYKERVHDLCATNLINSEHSKALVKILQMLNMPAWSLRNSELIRQLMLLLKDDFFQDEQLMSESFLRDICHMFQYHKEPAALMLPLSNATAKQFQKNITPETLVSYLPFAHPCRREPHISQLCEMINNKLYWQQPNVSAHFFNALRELKVADVKMCDAYWEHVADELPDSGQCSDVLLLRHCHNYMNFNNNLGGSYRYLPLEEKFVKLCMHSIVYDTAGIIPWKFARLAAFAMGYGHTPNSWKKFPNLLLSKIINMATQFTVSDCYTLSRGIQIALELRFRFEMPSLLALQLATIDSILITSAERYLHAKNELTLSELNALVHALANRKTLKKSVVYHEALNRYKDINYTDLNSRTIREMCYNFNTSNFLIPEALESMFNYIEQHHEHVLGDTVEKVLFSAYNLGYTPKFADVFDYTSQILLRDFEHMRGLSLLKACMALCFYKALPEELINAIFCVNFIQRIEDEIQICYSRATYPERVQNMVMQLNRTVCLDFPETNVPWFQQNYIEAHMSKKTKFKSSFEDEVQSLLFKLLKSDEYVLCNHKTPYGYQIDFVIHFDKEKKLIPPIPMQTTMLDRITKVAILLMKLDSFCENDFTALRGADSMKIKHLEMLGYKVLHINEHDWYSKYMQAPDAKTNYIKCLLQISS